MNILREPCVLGLGGYACRYAMPVTRTFTRDSCSILLSNYVFWMFFLAFSVHAKSHEENRGKK